MTKKILIELCSYLKVKNKRELAAYLGIPVTQVYSWSKYGKIADTGKILAKHPELRIEWLETGQLPMFKFGGLKRIGPVPAEPKSSEIYQIPILSSVPEDIASSVKESTEGYIAFPNAPSNCYAIKVNGDSMEPVIKHGDYVLFVIDQDIESGNLVIVNDEFGDSIVKRYKEKKGKQFLVSDNPTYPTHIPSNHYRIMGVVVGAWRQLNI